jgi:hypothetical protein
MLWTNKGGRSNSVIGSENTIKKALSKITRERWAMHAPHSTSRLKRPEVIRSWWSSKRITTAQCLNTEAQDPEGPRLIFISPWARSKPLCNILSSSIKYWFFPHKNIWSSKCISHWANWYIVTSQKIYTIIIIIRRIMTCLVFWMSLGLCGL